MTPGDVKKFYKSLYGFKKATGMSANSLFNWLKWGYVPEGSQYKIERLSNGALKTEWSKVDEDVQR